LGNQEDDTQPVTPCDFLQERERSRRERGGALKGREQGFYMWFSRRKGAGMGVISTNWLDFPAQQKPNQRWSGSNLYNNKFSLNKEKGKK